MGEDAVVDGTETLGTVRPGDALVEQAYRALREAILHRRLQPGARLSVPAVAERLGISRTPAREAIARIAHEGLATVEPRRGAVVAQVSISDLRELYDLREVLEGLACRLAALHASASDVDGLRDVLHEHRRAADAGDADEALAHDEAFHRQVRLLAGNRRLIESLDRLQGQTRLAMETTHRAPGNLVKAVRDHERILAALAKGDAEKAEALGRAHVVRVRRDLREGV